jgi:hypothetical protein
MKAPTPLNVSLVGKGSAQPSAPERAVRPPTVEPFAALDPPLRVAMPASDSRRQIGPRLPPELVMELRLMGLETGRRQNDLIETFIREGLARWREERRHPSQGD